MDNTTTKSVDPIEDYENAGEMTLGDMLAAQRKRLDRIESKIDDINNRLRILLELLRP